MLPHPVGRYGVSASSYLLSSRYRTHPVTALLETLATYVLYYTKGLKVSHAGSTSTKSIAGTASGTVLSKPKRAASPST